MEKILNFNEPLDVALLDSIVSSAHSGIPGQTEFAQQILTQFQEHPLAWTRVDTIIERSQNPYTKFYGLQILESVIKFRWKILPREQCEAIKNFIVSSVIKMSSDENTMCTQKLFLDKLDLILVQIIKQEWPKNWENFIPDIVSASQANETLCENTMVILRLMSEEVFDFSNWQITQSKSQELKSSFHNAFSQIFQLCQYVLISSQRPSLLLATLQTLLKFLNWIALGYIFETDLIPVLVQKFFPVRIFRNVSLECLTEIACLKDKNISDIYFEKLFIGVMEQLAIILPKSNPEDIDFATVYEQGNQEDCDFIQRLSLFLTGFFREHLPIVEKLHYQVLLVTGHFYLTQISLVNDMEIFKICLEYWNKLANDLYYETPYPSQPQPLLGSTSESPPRRKLYERVLSKLRSVLIKKMPKPEEVLIVQDENGEIVRETMKDTDSITLYKSMRETLIFLTHLDYEDTQNIMLEKLQTQVDGSDWSWNNLNTLCWAIGAISGAQNEDNEKRFLVTVIKDLLGLCEQKRGKDNKAVVASNIMYVVGQYPRFLRAHWKFLKTVVNKLFEFMHETHPGVQDMAVDTFLKISQKCRRKFVMKQPTEQVPFVEEILTNLTAIVSDLEHSQIQTFYEALGYMIQSHTDSMAKEILVAKLMEIPNIQWRDVTAFTVRGSDHLRQNEILKTAINFLKINVRACYSLGHCYISQFNQIYLEILSVYKIYSQMISDAVATGGPVAAKTTTIKFMRTVKKETLKLIETFVERCEDPNYVSQHFIAPLLENVLADYKNNIPATRDPEVLSLMAMIINKLKNRITPDIPRIFEHVFESTLGMITQNFQDYPDIRHHFFTLLRAINSHCFAAFFSLSATQFKLVIDSIVWAMKHTEREISETGLTILEELLQNIKSTSPEIASALYRDYFISLLQDVFFIITDSFHKSGFKQQSSVLQYMVCLIENGGVNVPLWDLNNPPSDMNNSRFVREYLSLLFSRSFPNLTAPQIKNFIVGLFELRNDLPKFKSHLRDFLIQLKEFAGDSEELFTEEREAARLNAEQLEHQKALAIPGMIPPNSITHDDME